MRPDGDLWPEGMWRAEIRQVCTPRETLLNGDTAAVNTSHDRRRMVRATQMVSPQFLADSVLPSDDIKRETEQRLMVDVMLQCWRDGYWPVKPLVVRWYRNTARRVATSDDHADDLVLGFNWVEQTPL